MTTPAPAPAPAPAPDPDYVTREHGSAVVVELRRPPVPVPDPGA